MNDISYENGKVYIKNVENFSLAQTFGCGQAFRWRQKADGKWCGIALEKYIELYQENNNIIIENTNKNDFENIWFDYFDLGRNYGAIAKKLCQNDKIAAAYRFADGIRILNQEPFETLCSFIISQNNNIPRIVGIIDRLCENFGEKTEFGYTFPKPYKLAKLSTEDLDVLRSGFRAKYIIDAAKKVSIGEIDLENLRKKDLTFAQNELMKIKGVGPKVADCTLLYGLKHIDAFPKDVWIKRALEEYFDGQLPECAKEYAGIAQQYIFHYIRAKSR